MNDKDQSLYEILGDTTCLAVLFVYSGECLPVAVAKVV